MKEKRKNESLDKKRREKKALYWIQVMGWGTQSMQEQRSRFTSTVLAFFKENSNDSFQTGFEAFFTFVRAFRGEPPLSSNLITQ
jgi:hypothetical protein